MQTELFAFYTRHQRANPTERLTRLSNLTVKMVGRPAERKLATKTAKAWSLLLFCNDFLQHPARREAVRGAHVLMEAGEHLERFCRQLKEWGMQASAEQRFLSMRTWQRFVALTRDIPVVRIPKMHAIHLMIIVMGFRGNPRAYANWIDKALNRILKSACRNIGQRTFESRVLLCMPQLLQSHGRKRGRED
jgi:hypothetical protein